MKQCQHKDCDETIQRGTAIFCPYCGRYQEPTGWHYHQLPMNRPVGPFFRKQENGSTSVLLSVENPIIDCLADGNVLAVQTHDVVTGLDLDASKAAECPHTLWSAPVQTNARITILRPFLVIIESNRIRGIHLDTHNELKFLSFMDQAELMALKHSTNIIPVEHTAKNRRQAYLIFAKDRSLLIIAFNLKNQYIKHVVKSIRFQSPILSFHLDDADKDWLYVYSVTGEFVRLCISETVEGDSQEPVEPESTVYAAECRPSGGFQVEWVYSIKGSTYFLVRKTTGDTFIYRTIDNMTELLTDQRFNKKPPSAGRGYPLILCEDNEYPNSLWGFNLTSQEPKKYNLNVSEHFLMEHQNFQFDPHGLLHCAGMYWALCPSRRFETSPYEFVNLVFQENGQIRVQPLLNIPIRKSGEPGETGRMLPLMLSGSHFISYTDKTIILIG